ALSSELDRNAQSANYNGISLINNAGNTAGSALFDKDISKGITFTASHDKLIFVVTSAATPTTTAAADAAAKIVDPLVKAAKTAEDTAAAAADKAAAADTATKTAAAAAATAAKTAADTADNAVIKAITTPGAKAITVTFGTKALSANEIVGAINKQLKDAGVNANASINSEGHLKINSNDRVDGVKVGESTISTIMGSAVSETGLGAGKGTNGKSGFGDIVINVGSSGNSYDNIFLKTVNLSSEGLGLKGASLTNSTDLDETLSTLKKALDTVTEQRSHLGASQKRLTFASDNLQNVKNNTDASLSSIEDTDYAATTMQLAKEKVLNSASQAMLGQSNQMQSEVTQLLK
ncbi:flagellin, partial [Photobacterium phosphoreum]|uniref:flagellin n=2 Tax=Photobacterium phosphoreum TaxID=659 RepID=UPI0007F9423C